MQNSKKQRVFGGGFGRKEQIHQDKPGLRDPSGMKNTGDKKMGQQKHRRPAFGDLTNATLNIINETVKKTSKKVSENVVKKGLIAPKTYTSSKSGLKRSKIVTQKNIVKGNDGEEALDEEMPETLSSQESLTSSQGSLKSDSSLTSSQDVWTEEESMETDTDDRLGVPVGVDDVDSENLKDPVQVSLYAFEIFQYYKEREKKFAICPYLNSQPQLSVNMRAILVDWLVEVQENFELNHETLYLAVKMVDLYLSKVKLSKEHLQLVGATSLFIACKFDERCPPLIEDFLYICDDAYDRKQFIEMEKLILRAIDFDLGIPLSYRFLRRYAKCARATMETLTLGRYILELSLMEYNMIHEPDSKMAAAALFLAIKMKKSGDWTSSLDYYTGYSLSDITPLVKLLNTMVSNATSKQLATVQSKYSHEVFYQVAKVPSLTAQEMQF